MSTTTLEAAEAVVSRWLTQWVNGMAPLTPTILENEAGSEPAVPTSIPATDADRIAASWVRLTIRHLASTQDSLGPSGARRFARRAQVIAQIFTPPDIGIEVPLDLASRARAVFEGASFDGVDVYDVNIRELGTDGRWHQVNVEAAFTYHEQK